MAKTKPNRWSGGKWSLQIILMGGGKWEKYTSPRIPGSIDNCSERFCGTAGSTQPGSAVYSERGRTPAEDPVAGGEEDGARTFAPSTG